MGVYEKPVTSGVNNGGIVELGNGLMMYCGSGVFVTTAQTAVIYHPFGTGDIFSAIAGFTSTTIDQDDLQIGFKQGTTANLLSRDTTYGTYKSVTAGAATVNRSSASSGLSAATFSIIMIGRARH